MTEGLAKMSAASDSLVAARETAAMTAVLRIHLDKEDQQLYPILRERTSLEEQSAIVGGMAAHVLGSSHCWDTMTERCGPGS